MIAFVIQDHPYCTCGNLRCDFVGCLAHRRPFLSGVGASGNPGAVQSEQTYDYEEHISHAFALLRGKGHVAAIEPLTDEEGVELGVKAYAVGFGTAGVIREAAGDHAGRWSLKLGDMFSPKSPSAGAQHRDSITINNDGGMGAVIAFHAGHGRGDYPLFQLSDASGQAIGVLADFFIDNRPW